MPIYEYECQGGHRFEHFTQLIDIEPPPCPDCKQPTKRVMSTFGFRMRRGKAASEIDKRDVLPKTQMRPEWFQ